MVSGYDIKSKMDNININKTVLIVLSVSMAVFVWSFSAGTVNIALPTISQYMDISTYLVSWVVIVHLLILTSFMLIFGRLGDIIGLRKVFLMGICVFTVSSYLCGISIDFVQLLLFRGLQGLGSAMLLSISPALISKHLNPNFQAKGFAAISAATTIALAAGYGAGGLTLQYCDWNWVFLIVVPLGIIAFILNFFFIPPDTFHEKKLDFDLVGAFLILIVMVILILSIYVAKDMGLTSKWFIGGICFDFILFSGLIHWENKQKYPIFDLNLLKDSKLLLPLLAAFLITLVFMGTIFLVPFYLDLIMGYSTAFSGILILIPTLLVLIAGPLSGVITDKFGSKIPTVISCIFLLISLGFFILTDPTTGIIFILIALSTRFLSEGFFAPANNKQIMKNGYKGNRGSISSLMNTSKYMGIILGVVIFDAIFESTIVQQTTNLANMPVTGALHLAAPVSVLLSGFQNAFLLGLTISLSVLVMVLLSRQWEG
ncbi:MFS transporter [Methanobacterium alcaliphilum]|uniref:MFS transporter n=1 Tax=Methanobacterium alcaliphilum TaxID=392018 RepID=UPI00200B0E02|nr:MFS transporter [Methanobacterium alcaliphilum]MCK9150594.1 MFS transporter [Methanobacterium alcaliphilum]